jgi:hypothetical protein
MTFQPLPPPFQPYAKVYAIVSTNPVPTPVLPYPHTPKALRLPYAAWRSLCFGAIWHSMDNMQTRFARQAQRFELLIW